MKDPLIVLAAASHALRAYQYGNADPTLAQRTADVIDKFVLDEEEDAAIDPVAMVEAAGGTIDKDSLTVLPDGSGCFTASWPLPKDHWVYEPAGEPPAHWRVGEGQTRDELAHHIEAAIKYAYRGATMSGKDFDIDPDALVQNMKVGMLGYWTHDGFSHLDDIK